MTPPNVFFLVIDSLRADAIFGDRVPTPNIDAFADRGAAFRQCVCTCTTTTPSFSSILTGCYPPKHGVRGLQGYSLSPSLTTLAEAFSKGGYRTYAEVTGPLLPQTGVLRGFEEHHHRPAYKVPFFGWREDVLERMKTHVDPWFMLLHIWEVHRPYRSPPNFEKRRDKAGYEAAVQATDDWLKPIFDAVGDNTIVVITGDHGETYPETTLGFHGVRVARKLRRVLKLKKWFTYLDDKFAGLEIGHGFALWEHLIRVPLVIAGPNVPKGTVADQVRHVDLLPTLLDLCDIGTPEGIDGRSLKPLMTGDTLPDEPAYLEAVGVKLEGNRIVGARTPEFKYLKQPRGKPALYSLDGGTKADEKHNVFDRYPEVARSLEAFVERIGATEAAHQEGSGMTSDEEAVVEQHLRDLGYL